MLLTNLIAGVVSTERLDTETPPSWMHSGQRQVWESTAENVVACAGAQGGKTCTNPYWLLREIQRTGALAKELGRGDYLYVGPTLQLLQAQAIPQLRAYWQDELQLGELVGERARPKFIFSKEGVRKLIGADIPLIVHFAYASDPNNLESLTALAAVWDEAGQTDNKESSYDALGRRLSIARSRGFGRTLFTTTPYEWGWFKSRVVDRALSHTDGFSYISWCSWENPLQDESVIRKRLEEGMPEWAWKMFYMAEWTRPAGAVYDSFDPERNICKAFKVPEHWPLFIGWDFGSANTAAVVLARDPDNDKTTYVVWSYFGAGEEPGPHVRRVREAMKRKETGAVGGASSEDSIRKMFNDAGMYVRRPSVTGQGSVEAGIMSVWKGFKDGSLKVFSTEQGLIDDLNSYAYKVDSESGKLTDLIENKSSYHRLDALRYVVSEVLGARIGAPRQVYGRSIDRV